MQFPGVQLEIAQPPLPLHCTVHPPCGQDTSQPPLPLHTTPQPAPLHVTEQFPSPSQTQASPGAQVLLVDCPLDSAALDDEQAVTSAAAAIAATIICFTACTFLTRSRCRCIRRRCSR